MKHLQQQGMTIAWEAVQQRGQNRTYKGKGKGMAFIVHNGCIKQHTGQTAYKGGDDHRHL
eukprot:1160104-Pelagomonas_calceolata.AAC.16